jgi:hypothetical protein
MNVRLIAIVGLILVFAGLVYTTGKEQNTASEAPYLPQLAGMLGQVTGLRIQALTDESAVVTINAVDGEWRLAEKSGYPADFERIAELLDDLLALVVVEVKTSKPENHPRLGVAQEGQEAGTSIEVMLGDEKIDLILGNRSGSRGVFVRAPDDPQVYLVAPVLRAPVDLMEWVDDIIYNVDSSQVQQVSILRTDGHFLEAERDAESGDFRLLNMPAGAELKYETIVDGLTRLLTNPRFQDVQPLFESAFAGATETVVHLVTGEQLRARTIKLGDEFWLHLDHESTKDWQYRISEYTFNEFNKTLEDLLKSPSENE